MTSNQRSLPRAVMTAHATEEERLYRTLNGMLEGCQIIDDGWHYLFVNDSVVKQSRRSREQLLGRTMMEIYPGIENTELFIALRRCMEERTPCRMHNHFDFGDGKTGWFDLSIQPVPEGIFILSIDITDAMRTEQALRDAEERFRLSLESSPHGIILVENTGRITMVNRELERMFGYSRKELLGQPVEILLSESLHSYHAIERTSYFQHPEARTIGKGHNLYGRRKNGSRIPVEIGLSPVQTHDGVLVLATVQDVSTRYQTEEILRESESRFRLLSESLPQLVWTSEPSGTCDFLSRQWVDYTGIPAVAQLGNAWMRQVHPDDRPALSIAWNNALECSKDFRLELRLLRHDGSYRWFDMRAVHLAGPDGRTVKWLGSYTDIDERKRGEEAQLRAQKMEALGTLAGGIAHDFNNILLAITGNAQLAIADLPPDHPVQESLTEIEKAGQRATNLVRRILAFSHQQEAKRDVISLQPVIEEVLKLLRSTLPAMIELKTAFAANIPRVYADSTQIYQIVMNLATNAAHAIGNRQGMIELGIDAVNVDEELARTIPGLQPGRHARLSVTDNGCGMDHQTLQRIFDPFFTTKPVGQGTGLGLSIVDGIMKKHGGVVTVYSQPGHGTLFRLYFPAAKESSAPATAEKPSVLLRPGSEHVMYVDDEEALVLLVSRTLERLGYRVTGFTDPALALKHLREYPDSMDAVVTDLSMPGMSGFELAREILAQQPRMPVILTSGYVRPEEQQEALAMGIRAMIMKPNTVEELGNTLDSIFRGNPAPDSSDSYRRH